MIAFAISAYRVATDRSNSDFRCSNLTAHSAIFGFAVVVFVVAVAIALPTIPSSSIRNNTIRQPNSEVAPTDRCFAIAAQTLYLVLCARARTHTHMRVALTHAHTRSGLPPVLTL